MIFIILMPMIWIFWRTFPFQNLNRTALIGKKNLAAITYLSRIKKSLKSDGRQELSEN
jgi:hypothetical protein